MKTKLISIITITTFLLVSILPTVSFASADLLQKNSLPAVQTTNESDGNSITSNLKDSKDKEEANKEADNQSGEENADNNQIDEGAVSNDNSQEADNQSGEENADNNQSGEENADNNQIDEGTVSNVNDALNTEGKIKSPDEVIALLQEKNISINDILKAINHISENAVEKSKELSDNKLESYADAFRTKIENQKEKIQDLHSSLEQLSDLYDKVGELEKAINVQKEAIKADYKDMKSYKKLGENLDKTGDKDIKVFSSGEQVNFDVQPVTAGGRTLVPIRAIAESLKSQVEWNPVDQTIILSKDGVQIKLTIGQDTAYVNDKEVKLDTPAESLNGRTMVPVRFITEAFKSTVKWEPTYKTVVIY